MNSKKLQTAAALAILLTTTGTLANAQSVVTQTFTLKPGWNAVFLDVQPEAREPATVFANLPVESVWVWLPTNSAVEFIQDPGEGLWNQPGWAVYFTAEDKTFLTNLHAVIAGWAYLIKLAGDQDATWRVTGAPSVKKTKWTPDSFNLAGFRVDPEHAPTFADYFAASPAHAGQAVYRLDNATGRWRFVDDPASLKIEPGEAYWVYCEGAAEYQGTLEVQLPHFDGLNFGALLDTLTVTLHNASNRPLTVSITPLSADIDLAYRTFNAGTGLFEWPPLQDMPPVSLDAGAWRSLRIAVRRETLQAERAESVILISDAGTRLRVPVRVEKEVTP